jgi:DNA-directed RNA polymerase subunit M/transcription elongation factor TFIIS
MICTGAERVILSVLVFPRRVEEWEEMGWYVGAYTEHHGQLICMKGNSYCVPTVKWAETLAQMGFFHQYEINAHPELQSKMLTRYREFWEVNVLGAREPEPQSMDDIKCLCPEPVGTIVTDLKYTCTACENQWRSNDKFESCPKCGATDINEEDEIARMIAERDDIKSEISASGALGKRVEQIKIAALDYMRKAGAVLDDESKDKWLLLSRDGRKLASYYRDKRGYYIFR